MYFDAYTATCMLNSHIEVIPDHFPFIIMYCFPFVNMTYFMGAPMGENWPLGFPTRSDVNLPVQSQKTAS